MPPVSNAIFIPPQVTASFPVPAAARSPGSCAQHTPARDTTGTQAPRRRPFSQTSRSFRRGSLNFSGSSRRAGFSPYRTERRRPVSSARVAVRMRGSTARSSRPYQTRSTLSPLLSGVGGIVRAKQVTDRRFARFGGRISACRCGAVATALRDTTGTPRAALFRNRLLCWHSQSDESLRSRRDKASYGQHAVILLSKVLRKFSSITFVW